MKKASQHTPAVYARGNAAKRKIPQLLLELIG
jgi:hypothetical protein